MAKKETFLPKPGRVVRSKELFIRLLMYAPPGFGKSYFADKFPDALVLSNDGNLPHYSSPGVVINNWEVVNPKTEDEIEMSQRSFVNVVDELVRTKGNGFKTIIVDLAEGMYELARTAKLAEYGMKHESDAGGFGKGYQLVRDPFNAAINKLQSLPVNLIYLSHEVEKEKKDRIGREFTFYQPNLSEKVVKKISGTGYTLRGYWKGSLTEDNGTSKAKRMLSLSPKDDSLHVARLIDANGDAVELNDIELTYENFVNALKDLNDPEKAGSFRTAQSKTTTNEKKPRKRRTKKTDETPEVKEEVKTDVETPVVTEEKPEVKEETAAPVEEKKPRRRRRTKKEIEAAKETQEETPTTVEVPVKEETPVVEKKKEVATKKVETPEGASIDEIKKAKIAALKEKYKNKGRK